MAVGPERWNNWKAGLLAELYEKADEIMFGVPSLPFRQKPESSNNYKLDSDFCRDDSRLTSIKITPQPKNDHTEVIVSTADRKGLFALLSGAMAAAGASIVDARIFTEENGMAVDMFQVQNLKGHVYENVSFLQKTIKAALDGKIDLDDEIRERQKRVPKKAALFNVVPRVIIDNNASVNNTVIEVNAKDRPGLLYDITSALSHQGLQISSAKVTTFGSRAVDVFYVRDGFGLKILHSEKLQTIENALNRALTLC
jgi:[protein-PII] uridylyltransferase